MKLKRKKKKKQLFLGRSPISYIVCVFHNVMELRNSPMKSPAPWLLCLFKSMVFWKESKGAQISEASTSLEPNMSSGAGTLSDLQGTAGWHPSPFPQGGQLCRGGCWQ